MFIQVTLFSLINFFKLYYQEELDSILSYYPIQNIFIFFFVMNFLSVYIRPEYLLIYQMLIMYSVMSYFDILLLNISLYEIFLPVGLIIRNIFYWFTLILYTCYYFDILSHFICGIFHLFDSVSCKFKLSLGKFLHFVKGELLLL